MTNQVLRTLCFSLSIASLGVCRTMAVDDSHAKILAADASARSLIRFPFPITSADYERLAPLAALAIPEVMLDNGITVDLELTRQDAFSADAQLVVVTAAGEQPLPRPRVALFSGRVVGEEESLAFLSVAPAAVQGFIRRGATTYIISCAPDDPGIEPIVFDLSNAPDDMFNWSPFQCEAIDVPSPPGGKGGGTGGGTGPRDTPCRVARIAFDTDNELLAVFSNNTEYATTYVATLVAGLSTIYKADVNTRIVSSYLRLWSDPDPWTATSTGAELTEFQNYWNANMGGVSRNAAHFLSTRPLGGGVAYIPALCNTPWAYAVSANLAGHFPFPLVDHSSQNWDIMVTAHELGHNFNGPHTHSTAPPIDNCGNGDCSQAWGGTIMSYCHTCSGGMTNIVLDLHPTIAQNYILPYLGGDIGCNLSDVPTIYSQPGSQTVCAYQPVTFTVVAASSNGAVGYQWYRNNDAIDGATSYSYTIIAPTSANAGNYAAVISDGCGSIASTTATLTVSAPANCPVPGDMSGDRHVDLGDISLLLSQYGLCEGDPGFNSIADIIQDGCVDLADLAVQLANYGL